MILIIDAILMIYRMTYFNCFKGRLDKVSSCSQSLAHFTTKRLLWIRIDVLVDDFVIDRFDVVISDATFDELSVGQQSETVRDIA